LTDAGCKLLCAGCGAEISLADPFPFRCPNARDDDDIDHVVTAAVAQRSKTRFCASAS